MADEKRGLNANSFYFKPTAGLGSMAEISDADH
jgi:hypothetical protein